jgi:hypothetical protein
LDAPLARVVRTVAQRERIMCLVASFQPRDGQSQLTLAAFLDVLALLLFLDDKEGSFIILYEKSCRTL